MGLCLQLAWRCNFQKIFGGPREQVQICEFSSLRSKPPDILRSTSGAKTSAITKPWQLIHRIDLHEGLKAMALDAKGPGVPATLHLRSKVIACDPHKPSITLEDGRSFEGDLVLGADGLHVRASIFIDCSITADQEAIPVGAASNHQRREYPHLSVWWQCFQIPRLYRQGERKPNHSVPGREDWRISDLGRKTPETSNLPLPVSIIIEIDLPFP